MTLLDSSVMTYHPFVSRGNEHAFLLNLGIIDFALDSQFQVQSEAITARKGLQFPFQSIYLDASAITSGTTMVQVSVTGQIVAIVAGYQGYRPLLANPGAQTFTISNAGAHAAGSSQVLRAYLLNVPVIGTDWGTLAGSGSGSASAVWG